MYVIFVFIVNILFDPPILGGIGFFIGGVIGGEDGAVVGAVIGGILGVWSAFAAVSRARLGKL